MIVGARQANLSISETANLLGYSCTTVCRVYREWTLKKKTCSGRQLCGRKSLVDDSGQKRMDKLVQSDSKATLAELTARYNEGLSKAISERTIRRTLKRLGYSKSPLGTTSAARASQQSTTAGQATVSSGQEAEATKSTDSVKVNEGGAAGEGCQVSQSLL